MRKLIHAPLHIKIKCADKKNYRLPFLSFRIHRQTPKRSVFFIQMLFLLLQGLKYRFKTHQSSFPLQTLIMNLCQALPVSATMGYASTVMYDSH